MSLLVIVFLMGMLVIGFVRFFLLLRGLEENRELIELFVTKFKRFTESHIEEPDPKLYDWLTQNALRVQLVSGSATLWKPFGEKLVTDSERRSQALIDLLEQMGQTHVDRKTTSMLTTFLTRCVGALDEHMGTIRKRQRNPLIVFREGIQMILMSPWLLLRYATGREDEATVEELGASPRLRSWVAFFTVVCLVVPLIILIVGWDQITWSFRYWFEVIGDYAERAFSAVAQMVEDLSSSTGPADSGEPASPPQ